MDAALADVLGQLDTGTLQRYLTALTTINDILDTLPAARPDEPRDWADE